MSAVRATIKNAAVNPEVDLALAVMCAITPPGVSWTRDAIAEVTGMSHGGPYMIEQRALMKLRKKFRYTTESRFGRELALNP